MKKQKGFSLIELLIVVAIILIIAAIAVPSLLSTISTAVVAYNATWGNGYPPTLSSLGGTASTTPSGVTPRNTIFMLMHSRTSWFSASSILQASAPLL